MIPCKGIKGRILWHAIMCLIDEIGRYVAHLRFILDHSSASTTFHSGGLWRCIESTYGHLVSMLRQEHGMKTYAGCPRVSPACKDADEGRGSCIVGGCAKPAIARVCLDAIWVICETPVDSCGAAAAGNSGA